MTLHDDPKLVEAYNAAIARAEAAERRVEELENRIRPREMVKLEGNN